MIEHLRFFFSVWLCFCFELIVFEDGQLKSLGVWCVRRLSLTSQLCLQTRFVHLAGDTVCA